MDADLRSGTLGRMFDSAEVLTIPQVKTTLFEKMEDLRHRSTAFETSPAFQMMQSTMKIAEVLQDFCASDAEVQRQKKRLLRLGPAGGVNAHLRDLQVDDEGNIIPGDAPMNLDEHVATSVTLKKFELVQLATLMPSTVEEAIALIPSLEVYNEDDLREIVIALGSSV